ncbi:hypothetical protein H6P81_019251 [Aristolochia fimbriata]|uniref:Exocyst subunit Exo70 family protein n=1 Tax=Aristolochia fimbriata TaxID=158543 RepID=A0AAV7DSC2_ARIFI|nr:hypothetical protein H6P81_019251 [Aristolochia fimbriata]
MSWKYDCSVISDGGQGDASVSLQSVDAILKLTETLDSLLQDEDKQVQIESLIGLQMAMARLEEVFCHILVQNKHLLGPQFLSYDSCEDHLVYGESFSTCYYSCSDYLVSEDSLPSVSADSLDDLSISLGSQDLEVSLVDMMPANLILNLKRIAQVMFLSNYDRQCCQAYIGSRKKALGECLLMLGIKKMTSEEVLMMDRKKLDQRVKRWNRAAKIFVQVLYSEKHLCDQIFDCGSASRICFIETSKGALLQLMNFAGAFAVGPHLPENLFCMLDMCKLLCNLLPDVEALFVEEDGDCVRTECHEVLKRVGDSIKGMLTKFENTVRSNTSSGPHASGCIHPFTIYVMNYIVGLIDCRDSLNLLFEFSFEEDQISPWSNSKHIIKQNEEWESSDNVPPLASRLGSIISSLESNLDGKSKLYKDGALQHFFLMNNMYYVVQKVESSALKTLLGGDWIRKHNREVQRHALSYERASWNSILSFLKFESVWGSGSTRFSKTLVKERFKSFNIAFEEIYKTQTVWLIADLQLREELRISISAILLPAYRTFLCVVGWQLESSRNSDKYIKYSLEDLATYLLDLFEGKPRSLNNQRSWRGN